MTGRWGGRQSPHVAKDFQLGALSSQELQQFKKLPPAKQNEIVGLLEKINFHRSNPEKAKPYKDKLKSLEASLGL